MHEKIRLENFCNALIFKKDMTYIKRFSPHMIKYMIACMIQSLRNDELYFTYDEVMSIYWRS